MKWRLSFPSFSQAATSIEHEKIVWLPVVLSLFLLTSLLILFRMKRVEMDYLYFSLNKDIEKAYYDKKKLTAQRAKLLSIKNLAQVAHKYQLDRPSEKQIIVIP